MSTPSFLDLLLPHLESPLFTIAVDKWGTGTWDFGHINATKYVGVLQSVAVDDSCNIGGSWVVANISGKFPEGTIIQASCGMFGKALVECNQGALSMISTTDLEIQTQATTSSF